MIELDANQNFQTEVLTRLTRIETKLDDYDSTKNKTEEANMKATQNEKRIQELEERQKWLARTIAGAFISGAIAIFFLFVKLGMGI